MTGFGGPTWAGWHDPEYPTSCIGHPGLHVSALDELSVKSPLGRNRRPWHFGNPLFFLTTICLSLITGKCKKDFLHSALDD
jgi:hypothetical protein